MLLNVTIILNVELDVPVNLEKDVIFNEVDLICSGCQFFLNIIEDDLARDIKAFWEFTGEDI